MKIADPSTYTTKTTASGTELVHTNDGGQDKLLTTASIAALAGGGGGGSYYGQNFLMNGSLLVNQRVSSGDLGDNVYGYDRWRTWTALGTSGSLKLSSDATTITMSGTVAQTIETPYLASATITVSVKNPNGPITVLVQPDAATAGVTGTITAGSGRRSVTLTVPSSMTGNVLVALRAAAVTTMDGPAKRGSIRLDVGSVAGPDEVTPFDIDVQRCRRYYEKTYNYATAPGTVTQVGYVSLYLPGGGNNATFPFLFTVKKRGTPTLVPYSPATGASGVIRDYGNNVDFTPNILGLSESGLQVYVDARNINWALQYTANADF
jgi:hypothetical protein